MKSINIIMSSYNGETVIERQIRSIMDQKNVDVKLFIRDDGSKDNTCKVIEKLQQEYLNRIILVKGENVGWKKSFLELLKLVDNADYYGFSDQDDFWLKEKLNNSIDLLEKDKYSGCKLIHVNSICTDEYLIKKEEQQIRYALPRNRKSVIAHEYFQGCSMVWNHEAMKLLKRYTPVEDLAHDFWVGCVCYYLGKVYYCEDPQFYHIRYESNSSSDGNIKAGRMKRLKMIMNNKTIYMNPSKDLIEGYRDLLQKKDLVFLKSVVDSKSNLFLRMKLFFDFEFRRESFVSSILFKLLYLFGKY